MDRRGSTVRRAGDDVLDGNRPASLEKGPEDEPDERLLPSRPASGLPLERIEGLQFISGQDHQVRQERPPLSPEPSVESVVAPDSRIILEGGKGMADTGWIAIGALSKHTGTSIEPIRYYERVRLLPAPPRSSGASGSRSSRCEHCWLLPISDGARAARCGWWRQRTSMT